MWRALLLDLDDTLLDRGATFERFVDDFFLRHANALAGQDRARTGARLRELDRAAVNAPRRFASRAVVELGLSMAPVDFAREFQRGMTEQATTFPRCVELLGRLRERIRVAVVTNGPSSTQRRKLEVTGLDVLLHAVFVSAEVGVPKPFPPIFARALAWARCPADQVLFVGDNPINDIVGAARAGMATAWITQGREFPDGVAVRPTYNLHDITSLEATVPDL